MNKSKYILRPAGEGDREAMGKVYCASWKKGYRGILPAAYLESLTIEICAPKRVNGKNNVVAFLGDEMAGLVNFGPPRESLAAGEGEIRAIYVHPAHWGKGAAEILFRSALKNLYMAGDNSVYLWVLKENGRARRFYEKMGLQASGVLRTVQIGGEDTEEIRYIGRISENGSENKRI